VYSEKLPDDGQRNCPKHVPFYSKNKFEKLVHLVGFVIRIFNDARSPERQNIYIYIYVCVCVCVCVCERLCGLVVRVSGYRYRGPGFDPRHYQIF